MKYLKALSIIVILVLVSSCSDDDTPTQVIEEEVITTMTITLTPDGGGTAITLQTRDTDGDGPNAPVVTSGTLTANTIYNGSIELLNELESPAEDITEEVEELDDEHQFFFQATNSIATFSYSDTDGDGNPVGLSFTLTTGSAGSGTVIVSLIHEPAKDASGVSDGDSTNAGGEEDISATFSVTVQ